MEWLSIAEGLGLTPLNMVLLAGVYFMGIKLGIFPNLKGKNGNGMSPPKWADQLINQVNHTQTDILERIAKGIEKLDTRSENQCRKLDSLIRNQDDAKDDDQEWRRESREFWRDLLKK